VAPKDQRSDFGADILALGYRLRPDHRKYELADGVVQFNVGNWQILLQKSFCTGDQKFSGL